MTNSTVPGDSAVIHRRNLCPLIAVAAIVTLGITLVMINWTGRSGSDPTGPLTITPSAQNTQLWRHHTITSTGSDRTQPAHTMSYVDGEFRVGSVAANTNGNRREFWALDHDYGDVDLTVRLDKPSSLGTTFDPQPGIVLRYRSDGHGGGTALIIDGNIWEKTFDQLLVGVWRWPSPSKLGVQIDSVGEPILMSLRLARITTASRTGDPTKTDVFEVDPNFDMTAGHGFARGDRVDIIIPSDPTFAQTNARVTNVAPKFSYVTVESAAPRPLIPIHATAGWIRFHSSDRGASPKALYPRYIRARIVGSRLTVKTWLVDEPEPGWQADMVIPERLHLARSGKVGVVTNHLYGAGQYMAFGDVTVTPINTSQ